MAEHTTREFSAGANQQGVRAHNERLILSMIQRHGEMPGSEIARRAGLSPQTVSVILRGLEAEGFVERGTPQRGHVGKPRVPMRLRAEGAYSIGLKIGRRNADLVLTDLAGRLLEHRNLTYDYPLPAAVLGFLQEGIAAFGAGLGAGAGRITGIGVARPFQLWEWPEAIGAPPGDLRAWEALDIAEEIARFSSLPVILENDATAACRSEHIFGRGREFRSYAYLFVGSFIGGGVVLNNTVFEGSTGNAGALGNLSICRDGGEPGQLLDVASLYLLEDAVRASGRDPRLLWRRPQDWSAVAPLVEVWTDRAARHLARAALTLAAVIDFEAVLIDGAFPDTVRSDLVARITAEIGGLDARGLIVPRIEAGSIGPQARELGAATAPLFARLLLNTHGSFGAG